jgi:chromosome segregation ATPase
LLFEESLQRLEHEKKAADGEIREKTDKIKVLNGNIEELEGQRKKLFEAMEEWGIKSKKIKVAYEEEVERRQTLENEVREQQHKFVEITNLFKDTKKEIETKNEQINYLTVELENFQQSASNQVKQYKVLQHEFEELKNTFSLTDIQKNELIRGLQDQNERLKDDLRNVNDKFHETVRGDKERIESEMTMHLETRNTLKVTENKIQELNIEIQDWKSKLEIANNNYSELQAAAVELKSRLGTSESNLKTVSKEKHDLRKKLEFYYIKMNELQKTFNVYSMGKIKEMKLEIRDLANLSNNIISNLNREAEFKI